MIVIIFQSHLAKSNCEHAIISIVSREKLLLWEVVNELHTLSLSLSLNDLIKNYI